MHRNSITEIFTHKIKNTFRVICKSVEKSERKRRFDRPRADEDES